jgi:hypothetical protein
MGNLTLGLQGVEQFLQTFKRCVDTVVQTVGLARRACPTVKKLIFYDSFR